MKVYMSRTKAAGCVSTPRPTSSIEQSMQPQSLHESLGNIQHQDVLLWKSTYELHGLEQGSGHEAIHFRLLAQKGTLTKYTLRVFVAGPLKAEED